MRSNDATSEKRRLRIDDVEIELPEGWVEQPNPGAMELRPRADGTTGLLHVSRLPGQHLAFIAGQKDLGAFAAAMGRRFAARGQRWGEPTGTRQGRCALGRFGFAAFVGGEYSAMLLWVTASTERALLWTWLGPDPTSEETQQALAIVLQAHVAAPA